jgi:methanethiol S-methyltransferase
LPASAISMSIYLACFALLHSLLASLGFKSLAWRRLGPGIDRWYTKAFGAVALITISPLALMLITSPGSLLYSAPLPVMLAMFFGQVLGGIGSVRAFTDAPHRFSVEAQLRQGVHQPLAIRGMYRFVRDPFLLSGLATIWLTPIMTSNLLVIYALASLYLFLGSLHWESRLQFQFGDEYRAYQSLVPRLIPRKGRCYTDR